MSLENLKSKIPSYAKDLKLNLSSLLNEDLLSEQQALGCFLASALASGNQDVIQAAFEDASKSMSTEALDAVKGAHGIMAMNNIYYKFVGFMEGSEYQNMQAKLRMNIIGNPGVDKQDFELWSLAVSAINGCKFCVTSHESMLVKSGLSKDQVQAGIRIAAITHAIAKVLDSEHKISSNDQKAQAA